MACKTIRVLALVGMAVSGLTVVGCSPNDNNNNQPYSLTGTSTVDQRFVDEKGHYRPDLVNTDNPTR